MNNNTKKSSFEELAEQQRQQQLNQFYNVDEKAVAELTQAVRDRPEKIQKRSGTVRSSWGGKL